MELEDLMHGRDVAADWLGVGPNVDHASAGWTLDDDGHAIADLEHPWVDAYEC
jgi:hypothetical protein